LPARARNFSFAMAPREPMFGVPRFIDNPLTCESGVWKSKQRLA
jgi:hypothetical protein